MSRIYIAIDLKSFFASVECRERGLDPLTTNLVVADASRTEKTICLAVTPSLKRYGIPGRARLFEVVQKVKEVNNERLRRAPEKKFSGSSSEASELDRDPSLELTYIVAPPQMATYVRYSSEIFEIYLNYIAPEDIHVYSIDEVFMDVTDYLNTYHMTAHELARQMIADVLAKTGITATAGIGSNLYLCKIAMDIEAKHMPADADGVRIAELDEMSYRRNLWTHRPIRDFWRVGPGIAKKLAEYGMYTMGDVARCSLTEEGEDLLYRLFGINAELLIDHAWGYEPTMIRDIKSYVPENRSISNGQVLHCPYTADKARIIVREMAEQLSYELTEKGFMTDQVVLTVGYDTESLKDPEIRNQYHGPVTIDHYGRAVPKYAHGSRSFSRFTALEKEIIDAAVGIYDNIIHSKLLIRRVTIAAAHILPFTKVKEEPQYEQLDLFQLASQSRNTGAATDSGSTEPEDSPGLRREKEEALQNAVLSVRKKYGKNAILKGTNFLEGSTMRDRNSQIGGHRA